MAMDRPVEWTAEERLAVIACLLAHKRAEAMHRSVPRAARSINHESMLCVAVLNPAELDDIWESIAPLCEGSRSDLREELLADIRRMFPPHLRPSWV